MGGALMVPLAYYAPTGLNVPSRQVNTLKSGWVWRLVGVGTNILILYRNKFKVKYPKVEWI